MATTCATPGWGRRKIAPGQRADVDARLDRFYAICDAASTAAYTPSDFTGIEFSQDELDQLVSELEQNEDD